MNPLVYNISIGLGVLLVSVGVGFFDFRLGLIAGGGLVLGLSIFHLKFWKADVSK